MGRNSPKHGGVPFFLDLDVCRTPTCQRDANQLVQSLNQSVNPCDDFYEFACGGWLARNQRPRSAPTWSQWEPVMQTIEDQLRDILENNNETAGEDFEALSKARQMYSLCMRIEQHGEDNTKELFRVLEEYGSWPMISETWSNATLWQEQVAKINADFLVSPILKFHVSPNLYNTSEYLLYIDNPTLAFPYYMLSSPLSYKTQIKSYIQWIFSSALEIARVNKRNVSLKKLKQDALELVEFETQIAALLASKDAHNLTSFYKLMTLDQLQLWTDLISSENRSIIMWKDLCRLLVPKARKDTESVIVKDLVFILKLIELVDNTPKRTVANYLAWNIVKYFAKDVSVALEEFSFKTDKVLYGIEDNISRRKYCVYTVNKQIHQPISHEYMRKHLNAQIKRDIEMLMDNIKKVLVTKLGSLQWLDAETKQKAIEKASAVTNLAAYPKQLENALYIEWYYKDFNISHNHVRNIQMWNHFIKQANLYLVDSSVHNHESWPSTVTDVNAYYDVLQNSVILPGGLLQYPFYGAKRLKALNYGAIGTIIGHEYSHAFDNTGRQADKDGNFKQWWTEQSLQNYKNHMKCFETHYVKHISDILGRSLDSGRKLEINVKRTQDENIADTIGLNLAYSAYVQIKHTETKRRLPGLEKFTADQLFFISFATQWCEVSTEEQLVTQILDSEHTPSKLRIMGALSNSAEFSTAFNCPAKSLLNPDIKCRLW